MASSKRLKSTPLSARQRDTLINLIDKHKDVLMDRTHDFASVSKKQAAWEDLTKQFNAVFPMEVLRTSQQLKRAWEHVKKKIKIAHGTYVRKRQGTGGGPPPTPPKFDPGETLALSIISMELQPAVNQYDSMALPRIHNVDSSLNQMESFGELVEDNSSEMLTTSVTPFTELTDTEPIVLFSAGTSRTGTPVEIVDTEESSHHATSTHQSKERLRKATIPTLTSDESRSNTPILLASQARMESSRPSTPGPSTSRGFEDTMPGTFIPQSQESASRKGAPRRGTKRYIDERESCYRNIKDGQEKHNSKQIEVGESQLKFYAESLEMSKTLHERLLELIKTGTLAYKAMEQSFLLDIKLKESMGNKSNDV